jgi:hypothetical protein
VTGGTVPAGAFFLSGAGADLGTNSSITESQVSPNVLAVRIGSTAMGLTVSGETPGISTGIDVAADPTLLITNPATGLPAVDGGVQGVDDEAIDLRWRLAPVGPVVIGSAGGALSLRGNPASGPTEFELTRGTLTFPPGALAQDVSFRLRSIPTNLAGQGAVTAVAFEADPPGPANLLNLPATLTVEYRDIDVNRESGQIEGSM